MTYEEAYDRLYGRYAIIAEEVMGGYEETDLMLEALGKQIPKKPIRACKTTRLGGTLIALDDDEYVKCPTCGGEVDYKEHHCKCGQSLDWE